MLDRRINRELERWIDRWAERLVNEGQINRQKRKIETKSQIAGCTRRQRYI